MGRALEPLFVLLTLPGAVASAGLQRACDRLFLPAVDALEGGESLPYPGLVAATAIPFATLTAAAVAAFALSGGRTTPHWELLAVWLGVSLAVHATPGEGATAALYSLSLQRASRLRWIGLPLAALSRTLGQLRVVWLDLVYALLLFGLVRTLAG